MKRTVIPVFLAFLALLCLVPSGFAAAPAAAPKNVVLIDAKSGKSFVPLSFLKGFAGASVQWTEANKQIDITDGEKQLTLFVGKTAAQKDGAPVTISDAPFSENGTTYIPLQFISEALGYSLEWSKNPSAVSISRDNTNASLPAITRGSVTNGAAPIVSARKTFKVGSKSISAQMVTISLMHPKIKLDVVLAEDTAGKVENLSSIAKRSKATVAINGTFFDAYTKDSYKAPYGYIVSKGELRMKASGDKRTIFTYDNNLLANLIPGADFNEHFNQGSIQGALQAGPRLLVDGKVSLDVKAEGFKDPKILTGGGARSALGLTRDHKLILLTTSGATIPQLAEMMKQAGAYQAMNLDGGASSGLYYNGKYLTTPGRQISNALVVKYQ
ncbi:phosphodiester glycosidase family protein [Paenibacillus sp. Marseille-P2973]|uniref:phosphodiester glycosidase family protein n=1 Tax=Paenibacillus sp. Marseille-P2973 TaxID=1871032 RepID=UPI001B37A72C|nr:phosphodiester glycosidase family protein [Paenibacillus sp. Marseille-P2973]MBQ4900199.1 phosphodiester glycosidase family protein [Paenibacillus sp. Marseille-P2973]